MDEKLTKTLQEAVEAYRAASMRKSKHLDQKKVDGYSLRIQLVHDIDKIFMSEGRDVLRSQDICDSLVVMRDRPWGNWRSGRPLIPTSLAYQLKILRIKSKSLRIGGKTYQCYERDNLKKVLDENPAPRKSVEPLRSNTYDEYDAKKLVEKFPNHYSLQSDGKAIFIGKTANEILEAYLGESKYEVDGHMWHRLVRLVIGISKMEDE
jgi:hypothetical protein